MATFNPAKYQPAKDSSPTERKRDPESVVLVINRRKDGEGLGCPCGCGGEPKSRKTVFVMGHDARLRGKLIRAHVTGTKVIEVVDGEPRAPKTALAIAKQHGWEGHLTAAATRQAEREQAAAERAKRRAKSKAARGRAKAKAARGRAKATRGNRAAMVKPAAAAGVAS